MMYMFPDMLAYLYTSLPFSRINSSDSLYRMSLFSTLQYTYPC